MFQPQTDASGSYGKFSVDANGNWTYTLTNTNPAVQALGVNETLGEAFTVKSADGTTHIVNIVINGTNDVPEVSGPVIGAVTEDGTTTATGQLVATDVDKNDTLTWEVTGSATGAYGTIAIDQTGKWTYTLDNDKAEALTSKDKPVETFTVTVSDGHGGTVTKTIEITVNGSDNGATITPHVPGDDKGEVIEDGQLTAGGKLDVTDPDAGQAVFVTQTNVPTTHGQFSIDASGNWTYTLNNNDPAVQALGFGQTLTETREVTTADGTTANVVITINGTNDVPTLVAGVSAVTEDVNVSNGKLSTSGAVTISDVDTGENSFQPTAVFNGSGTALGTLVFNTNGTYSYSVDNSKVQFLKTGESIVETYTVTSKDGSATSTIKITINGADDGAVITPNVPGADKGTVTEDTKLSTGGKLDVTDPDAGQAVFVAQNDVATTYGKFSIDANGTWTYTLTNTNAAVQALGAGQTLTETREVVTADGTKSNVVITINGTNDIPTLGAGVGAVTEDVAVTDGKLVSSGTVSITDVDTGESSFKAGATFTSTTGAAQLGTLVFNTDGSYSYSVDNSKVQYLKTGESIVETYTVTSVDGSAKTTIQITINGANDGAVITPNVLGADKGSVTEDGTLTTGGKLDVSDLDAGQAVFVVQNNVTTTYGKFSIDANGNWSYQLSNDSSAVQALAAGQTLTEKHTVTTADGTTSQVEITINGTNDAPTISGVATGAVTEDATVTTVSGQLTKTDVDTNDTHTWTVSNSGKGQYGTFAVDATGKWAYVLDNTSAQVQALAAGQQVTDNITVTVDDGKGGKATQLVTVTVNGANDLPTIGGAFTGAVTEDATVTTVSGQLTKTDVDANDTHTWTVSNSGKGQYGTFAVDATGKWTYVLDNTSLKVQALAAGQQVTDTITVTIDDGKGGKATQLVTVTVNGANDAPTIGGAFTGAVTEDATVTTVSGQLTKTDVDTNDTHTWTVSNSGKGQYGTFAVDATGKWTYVLDNTSLKVQALAAGQQVTDTITVTIDDGKGGKATQLVTVTVNGTNDAPTMAGMVTGAVKEDSVLTVSGQLTKSDVDTNDTHTWSLGSSGKGQYGSFTVDATGKWTYVLDNANTNVQSLTEGQKVTDTITVTVSDNKGGSASKTISVEITGTNEAPVAQAVSGTAPEDNTVAVVLRGTDADGSVASFQLTSLAANGTFYKDAAGTQALTTSDVITATSNGATIYFKPTADWSGTTTFNYNAKDNLGQVSASTATGTITVTPVADTPVVNVQVGSGSTPVTTSITATTVGTANAGHTVTAKNADGGNASVSVITGTNHDGFGVAGAITTNTAAASEELAGNGTKSESLTIAFNVPVTKITVQFAWLASGEQARYVMYDEAGNVIKTATVQGVTDTVDEQFSLTAPVGTTIGKIVFDAPRNGDDYLIHKVTYTTATTYPLTITADPRDVDHSETISKVVVEVPAGVTLSVGTQIDATHWSLPLTSNGSYSVSVDATTKAITITGLNMTVPENVSVGEVKVVATASDGSSTAEGSYTYHGVPVANDDTATATLTSQRVAADPTLANFNSGDNYAWKFVNGTTTVDKDTVSLTSNTVLTSDQGKWLSTSLNSTTLDAQISNSALVLRDNNGGTNNNNSNGDVQLVTPIYTVSTAGTVLKFDVTNVIGLTGGNLDFANWALYRSTNGTSWSSVQSGAITGTGTITTNALVAGSTYRIVMTVNEGYTGANDVNTAAVTFDNFAAVVPGATVIQWSSSPVSGSVTANDTLGTLGETSTLSVFNGSAWVNASTAGTTVNGNYGTLVLKSDGSYTYTPTASAAGAGKVEHFDYKLTQADGDTDSASLDITLNATGPGATSTMSARMAVASTETSEHEVHSTSGSDTLLGTAEDDLFVWHQGDAGTVARPVTDVVKNFGTSGNDKLDLADLLQGEEASSDLSKFLHLETRTEADGKTIDTVINVSTAGTLDAAGNGFNQQILVEGVNLTGTSHDQNTMIKELIEQGKLKIDHS
ncbi:MAG: VCBS domain-containing protein [Comamonas sp.]